MILDIIVIVVFLISTIRGKVNGFGESMIKLLQLIVAVFCGMTFTPAIADALLVTSIDERISERLHEVVVDGMLDLFEFIPGKIGDAIDATGIGIIEINIEHFTHTCVLVLAFALIVIAVLLVALLLRLRLRKERKKKSLVGTVDSGVGFLVGMIKGVILVFVFLAFMFPFAGVFMPEKIHAINECLNHSYIAGPLYDINPLILFVRKLPF